MTAQWRRRAAMVVALVLVAVLVPGQARAMAPRVTDPAQVRCSGVRFVDQKFTPDARGHFIPVVLVHGWTGSPSAFAGDINLTEIAGQKIDVGRSLIGQIQRIAGAAVFTFDYHDYSARWVDDDHLGPALGRALDCLYQSSGEKAIVVAHSMGGLVARWALTHDGRADEVSTVVTFGTPEQGSLVADLLATGINGAAAADPDGTLAVIRAVLAECGRQASRSLATGTLCDWLPDFVKAFDSDAGRALRAGSPQLAALAPFPAAVKLVALAGDTHLKVPVGWFGAKPWSDDIPVGDVIVARGSALSGAGESHDASCSYQLDAVKGATDQVGLFLRLTAANEVARPIWEVAGPCFHTNLMREIGLTNRTIGAIGDDIAARNAPPTFSFDGWGDIRIGMTRAEAEAAAPYPLVQVGDHNSCTELEDKRAVDAGTYGSPSVTLTKPGDRVAAITAYGKGPRTDRGIGIGATRAEILTAYHEPHTDLETQAGLALVIHGPHGNNLSFSFDDSSFDSGIEGPPVNGISVGPDGYAIGFELCSG